MKYVYEIFPQADRQAGRQRGKDLSLPEGSTAKLMLQGAIMAGRGDKGWELLVSKALYQEHGDRTGF